MFQSEHDRIAERCDAADAKAAYAAKQLGTPDPTNAGRIAVVEGLSAVARQMGAVAQSIVSGVVTCSLSSAEYARQRADRGYAISEALLAVAEAQTVPLLSSLPAFAVPARKKAQPSSGGACSLSMSSWNLQDEEDESLSAARVTIVETADSIAAFIKDGSQFEAGSDVAKFLAALYATPPASEAAVESAVEAAFEVVEN